MVTALVQIFVLLCVSHLCYDFVRGQNLCKISDKPTKTRDFPDPMILYNEAGAYQIAIEVNDILTKTSLYSTEYYDGLSGRVDSNFKGNKKSLLYLNASGDGEAFHFAGSDVDCDTTSIGPTPKLPYDEFNLFEWQFEKGKTKVYGPFAMLLNAFEQLTAKNFEGNSSVRGLKAFSWKRCENEGKLTIRYILLDETESMQIFGLKDKAIPLRVTVEGTSKDGQQINQSYEFLNFQFTIHDKSVLEIPKMKGCERLVEDLVKMPFKRETYSFRAEIVYVPVNKEDEHIYISDLEVVGDDHFGLLAYQTTPWKAQKDGKLAVPADEIFRVFDSENGFLYEVDKEKSECSVKKQDNFNPVISLPDGQDISLFEDSMLPIRSNIVEGFHYLGEETERGKRVFVFEKKETFIGSFISTHYYLIDNVKERGEYDERMVPLKIVYSSIGLRSSFQGLIVFNIYSFSSHLIHKPDHFDVSSCFKKNEQSEWFRLIFPIDNFDDKRQLMELFPKIKTRFYEILEFYQHITPVRLPEIQVNIDVDYLYVTAKLLERAPYEYDFSLIGSYRFVDPDKKDISSKEDCFKTCLRYDTCKAFSYCGANCQISFDDYEVVKNSVQEDTGCQLYNRTAASSQRTIHQIYERINSMVYTEGLTMLVPFNETNIPLKVKDFQPAVAYGDRKVPKGPSDATSRFTIFNSEIKFKNQGNAIKVSYSECKEECLKDPHCNSISFCYFSSLCVRRWEHATDYDNDDFVTDSQCIVLDRNFEDFFTPMDGLHMVTTATSTSKVSSSNACAKQCFEATFNNSEGKTLQCHSFDFCYDKDTADNCFLHTTHILDAKDDHVVSAKTCSHYSRNYIYDFEEYMPKVKFWGSKARFALNITLDECAKFCIEDPECIIFDFCGSAYSLASECAATRTQGYDLSWKDDLTCTVYQKKFKDLPQLKMASEVKHSMKESLSDTDNVRQVEVIEDTGYSKSLTGGIAFFMFLVGIAIGGAVMFGYGYYKANRHI